MTVAAVLPAASELTMLYGGALASGALAGSISLFGHEFQSGLPAYLAVVVAGVVGNTLGAAGGWWIGVHGGHPLLERYGRYVAHHARRESRAPSAGSRASRTSRCRSASRRRSSARSSRSRPGFSRSASARFLLSAIVGITVFCAVARRNRLGGRLELAARRDHDFATSSIVVVRRGRGARRVLR